MKRKYRDPGVDSRMFTNTATKVKAINLPSIRFRGGIRL